MVAMPVSDIIVMGASAGGVEALQRVASGLRPDFPAAVFVVLHVPPWGLSKLPEILTRSGPLPASHPADGSQIRNSHIYVAPPDQHLVVNDGHIQLSSGPKENRHRPAVNVLFRSASLAYGPRVIGVILTGALDDGTSGLWEIKQRGGMAIVQEPSDAMFPDMPRNALENVPVDRAVSLEELPRLLGALAGRPVALQPKKESTTMNSRQTDLTCPECRGPISETRNGPFSEFSCRVGHRYSPETFLAAHKDTRERALWAAVVALEEGAEAARDLSSRASAGLQRRLEQEAGDNQSAAVKIRDLLGSLTKGNSQYFLEQATDKG
jgi:two-component system chemotaxis response regulator CheB